MRARWVDGLAARKELGGGGDVRALARRRRARRLRVLNGRAPELDLLRRAQARERIAPAAERNAPMRHRARGVLSQHAVECGDGLCEPERMEQGDGAVEILPQGGRARRQEADAGRANLVAALRVIVLGATREPATASEQQRAGEG